MSDPTSALSPDTSSAFFGASLAEIDPEIAASIDNELGRQQNEIELIASENIVSRAVLEAQGSVLTNKYAEGYPGRRYYGGCEFVDIAERLAIDRAKELFDCGYANVQPHSGSQANQQVFFAVMQPGDTFLGMSLAAGGHLTHGAAPNQSGKWFNAVQYGVRKQDALIDFDEVESLAREHKPKLLWCGTTAGLVRLEGDQRTDYGEEHGAPTYVWSIAQGDGDNLWIGGFGALARLVDGKMHAVTEPPELVGIKVQTVYQDSRGDLWIGRRSNKTVIVRDGFSAPTADSTCAATGCPATGCSSLIVLERRRVPLPAARTTTVRDARRAATLTPLRAWAR